MTPRLKAEFWVHALLRRCSVAGLFGAVLHKGAAEAGAVYVIINHLDGTHHFFGPPPGPAYDDDGERRFIEELSFPATAEDIASRIARLKAIDPDLWVVEIEDRQGTGGIRPVPV